MSTQDSAPLLRNIPWNKGLKIDRSKYPNYGHLQKHTKEALRKITEANIRNAKKYPKSFFQEAQKLAIEVGKRNHSYKGRPGIKELSARWLGDKAGYSSKHKWIQKHWIKKGICDKCGSTPKPYANRRWGTEWHSLDGEYDREDRSKWLELCKPCHNKYEFRQRQTI